MTLLPHLAARLIGVPLAIQRQKLDLILAVLGPRVGVVDLAAPPGFTAPARAAPNTTPGVAVIPIHGTMVRRTLGLEAESGLTSYTQLAAQLDAALSNPKVTAILLDVDSPGGESGGVFDLADRIRAACAIKPVWAVANDMAFSGAYALASAANRLFVSRTGGAGSIGVIAVHVDQSGKDAQDGLRYSAVFAGARKNDLTPHEPLETVARAHLQVEVNRTYALFVETVARHRGMAAGAVRATEAALFFGQDAVDSGLADAVGTFDDALAQLLDAVSPGSPLPNVLASQSGHSRNPPPKESSMNDRTHSAAPDCPVADCAASASAPLAATTVAATNAMASQPVAVPAGSAAQAPAATTVANATGSAAQAAPAMTALDAIEIAQTCALAARTDLTAGFLEAQASPAQVRSQLLAAKAQAGPEIVSRIDPHAATLAANAGHPSSPDNPLIRAVKARVG